MHLSASECALKTTDDFVWPPSSGTLDGVVDRDVLRERKKKEEAMGKKKGEEAAAALATDLMAAASTAAGAVAEAVEAVGVKMGGRATPPPGAVVGVQGAVVGVQGAVGVKMGGRATPPPAVSPSGAPSAARANVGAEEKHPEAANERDEMLEMLDQYREKLRKDRGAKEQSGGLLFYFVLYDAVVVLLICIGWLVLLTCGLVVPSSVFR